MSGDVYKLCRGLSLQQTVLADCLLLPIASYAE